jgi:hypothetical protein
MAFLDRTALLPVDDAATTADDAAAAVDDVLSEAVEVGLVATPETVVCTDTVG